MCSDAMVAQASARRETSHRRTLGSMAQFSQVSRDAQGCGTLGNAKREPLRLYSDRERKESCTAPQIAQLRRHDRLYRKCVAIELLMVHASAAGSGTRTKGCTELC